MTRALILATCAALLTGTEALGQEAELRRRHAEKLQQPFLQRNGWETDYDQALARAQAAGSAKAVVFAYFTRSYGACPPCDALERGPFSSPEFARFAESVVPYCHVTTRIPGHPRDDLLPKVCGPKAGTPSIAYLDAQGRVIAIHRGELGVEAFQRFSEQTRRYLRLGALMGPRRRRPRHRRAGAGPAWPRRQHPRVAARRATGQRQLEQPGWRCCFAAATHQGRTSCTTDHFAGT